MRHKEGEKALGGGVKLQPREGSYMEHGQQLEQDMGECRNIFGYKLSNHSTCGDGYQAISTGIDCAAFP